MNLHDRIKTLMNLVEDEWQLRQPIHTAMAAMSSENISDNLFTADLSAEESDKRDVRISEQRYLRDYATHELNLLSNGPDHYTSVLSETAKDSSYRSLVSHRDDLALTLLLNHSVIPLIKEIVKKAIEQNSVHEVRRILDLALETSSCF